MALFIMVVALVVFCFLVLRRGRSKNKATKKYPALTPRPVLKMKGKPDIRLWCGRCLRCYRRENLDLEVKDEVALTKDEAEAIIIAAIFQFGGEPHAWRKIPKTFGELVKMIEAANSPEQKEARLSN